MLNLGQNSAVSIRKEREDAQRRARLNAMAMAREALISLPFEQALQVMAQYIEEHDDAKSRPLRCFAQTMDRHADQLERI